MWSKLDVTGLPVVQIPAKLAAEEVAEAGGDHASLHENQREVLGV